MTAPTPADLLGRARDDLAEALRILNEGDMWSNVFDDAQSPLKGISYDNDRVTASRSYPSPRPADIEGAKELHRAKRALTSCHQAIGRLAHWVGVPHGQVYGYPTATSMAHAIVVARWTLKQMAEVALGEHHEPAALEIADHANELVGRLTECQGEQVKRICSRCKGDLPLDATSGLHADCVCVRCGANPAEKDRRWCVSCRRKRDRENAA